MLIFFLIASGCSTNFSNQGSPHLSAEISENLDFRLPKDFRNIGGHNDKDGVFIRSYESSIFPSERISHYFFPNAKDDILNFYQQTLSKKLYATCRQKTFFRPILKSNKTYRILNGSIYCHEDTIQKKASFANYSVVYGINGIYVLERIKFLPVDFNRPDDRFPLSPTEIATWGEFFNTAGICTYYSGKQRNCIRI